MKKKKKKNKNKKKNKKKKKTSDPGTRKRLTGRSACSVNQRYGDGRQGERGRVGVSRNIFQGNFKTLGWHTVTSRAVRSAEDGRQARGEGCER